MRTDNNKPGNVLIRDWLSILNNIFANEVMIFGVYHHLPNLILSHNNSEDSVSDKSYAVQDGVIMHYIDELHALLVDQPDWNTDPVQILVRPATYSEVFSMRNRNLFPEVLSVSVLLVCAETDELILHRRSSTSSTYPGFLHTLGGAYRPPESDTEMNDGISLKKAAEREVFEESGLRIDIPDDTPTIISKELSTGFIQVGFWAIQVSKRQLNRRRSSEEGALEVISFRNLMDLLKKSEQLVPTARAHIASWLALGMPSLDPGACRKRIIELFSQ